MRILKRLAILFAVLTILPFAQIAQAAIGACGSDPNFSFNDSGWHYHTGSVTWSESGITDPAKLSAVSIVIHLPSGSQLEGYYAPNGETVSFVNDQSANTATVELEVVPVSGYTCTEGGVFKVDASSDALSGGNCNTWDPATLPHFD